MYKLKRLNVIKIVDQEHIKDKLIAEGYIEIVEEAKVIKPKVNKKG